MTFFTLFSCKENSKNKLLKKEISGKYLDLKEDNISVFLPKYFKQYNLEEYKNIILSIEDSLHKKIELKRFNNLKLSKGNVYFLRDLSNTTDISIKMMDYFPFTKKDSSILLGMISQICNENAEASNKTCTKIKAGYSGNVKTKVFMAKYKVESKIGTHYTTFYAISSNYKSFIFTFRSIADIDYKKYIEKIIVK